MNHPYLLKTALLASALIVGLAGCQESAEDTASDVAEARADGQKNIAEAEAKAREARAEQRGDRNRSSDAPMVDAQELRDGVNPNRSANAGQAEDVRESEYDVAMAKAKATYDVEEERCEALAGADRDACMAQADAVYQRARLNAERRRDGRNGTPERDRM